MTNNENNLIIWKSNDKTCIAFVDSNLYKNWINAENKYYYTSEQKVDERLQKNILIKSTFVEDLGSIFIDEHIGNIFVSKYLND